MDTSASHNEPVTPESTPVQTDWSEIYHSDTFRLLLRRRHWFVGCTLVAIIGFFIILLAIQSFAPKIAAIPVFGAVNLSFVLSFAFLISAWVLGMLYSVYSTRVLEPLEESIIMDYSTTDIKTNGAER